MCREDLKADNEEAKYRTLSLLQQFILRGKYQDKRRGHEGRISEVGKLGKRRRESFYISVRSYFTHNRLPLPDDPSFKIHELDRAPRLSYMPLDKARGIIGALKEPYRTLYTAALYGGMGRGELLLLNELWPSIRSQLKAGKDPIRIDFGARKGTAKAYFTLAPAKVFKPYQDAETQPFQGVARIRGYPKDSPKIKRPIKDYDLNVAWRYARKRANITEPYTSHMLRDLFKTGLGYRLGLRQETTDFLTGHVARIDPNKYLQIIHEPETVIKEWEKIRRFLDSGLTAEGETRLDEQERTITDLRERLAKLEAIETQRLTVKEE